MIFIEGRDLHYLEEKVVDAFAPYARMKPTHRHSSRLFSCPDD
jgi:hypothetical protein